MNVPPLSFNRPLERVQRAFCWLIGEIRSWVSVCVCVYASETCRANLFFFFSIGWEHPLLIGTHLPRCVIVAHNGAHLIQTVQAFCSIYIQQVMFQMGVMQPVEPSAITYLPLNGLFCVIKTKFSPVGIVREALSSAAHWTFTPCLTFPPDVTNSGH